MPKLIRSRGHALVSSFLIVLITTIALPVEAVEREATAQDMLEPVVVTATLRKESDLAIASSVTVLDRAQLQTTGQQHLEDVLGQVPNLNFAAGTNRARYFQLRGIGELDQYEGAPNPSIGLLVDDIDFSGLGSMATLFDLDRIEVLRGPQGTRYGANALAGLMYLSSATPRDEWGGRFEADVGDYGTRSVGAVLTGPVSSLDSSFRIAAQRYTSDGFYRNDFLQRSDTNGRDESTVRGRWHWTPTPAVAVDLSAVHVAINDGYDAFSPENTRTVHSDKPGVDRQHSSGASLHVVWNGDDGRTVTAIGTWADSRIVYGYDGDWGNPQYWAPYVYDFTEVQHRHRTTHSGELRYASAANSPVRWLAGLYAFSLKEQLNDLNVGVSIDPVYGEYDLHTVLDSGYQARSVAAYGVLEGDIDARTHWSIGLRGEHRRADYADALADAVYGGNDTHAFAPSDQLIGGHASINHDLDTAHSVYLQVARGYKAGGFNLSQGISPSEINFRPESDWNIEVGYKAHSAAFQLATDVFVVSRHQAQLRSSIQTDPTNPNSFIFYTGNAASGLDYGAEGSLKARITDHLSTSLTLGLLHTSFHNFVRIGATGLSSVSRELPHAPHASGSAQLEYRLLSGWYARLDVSAMSAFYYDLPPNETQSSGYGLAHVRVGYDTPRWSAGFYVRNLANRTYTTRGFYFGLEPPDYPNTLYVQLGEPRVYGLDVSVRVGSLER
jgi:outer membrane receptor protein involved in Fe transport